MLDRDESVELDREFLGVGDRADECEPLPDDRERERRRGILACLLACLTCGCMALFMVRSLGFLCLGKHVLPDMIFSNPLVLLQVCDKDNLG